MRVVVVLLLFVLPQTLEPEKHSLDLEPLLQDPQALRRLTVVYLDGIVHKGWIHRFFVRGDGSLILQAFPERPLAVTNIPTCRAQVSQEVSKDLVRLIIKRHFFELPERLFLFVYAAQVNEELELHTIVIDDGQVKTRRTFGAGMFDGEKETIPADFLAIEHEMRRLRDSVFPPGAKPCHFAPASSRAELYRIN
jgi:hypothetical protein